MKEYRHHERVKAAQIVDVTGVPEFLLDDGTIPKFARAGILYHLDDGTTQPQPDGLRYLHHIGGYVVEYEDGYRSISPREAFEDGYREVGGETESREDTDLANMRAAAEFLFDRLDDIDTASDACKGDDAAYRQIVERIQARRFEVADVIDDNVRFHCEISVNGGAS